MPLSLYLDDCVNSDLLADLLTHAGHTVVRPGDVGMLEEDDDVHLAYTVLHNLILVTKNPADFLALHNITPNHAGIFAVYQDNDITRDMSDAEIVAAIATLESTVPHGYPIAGEFHRLNDWR